MKSQRDEVVLESADCKRERGGGKWRNEEQNYFALTLVVKIRP